MKDQLFPKLPLADWVEAFVEFLQDNITWFFDTVQNVIETVTGWVVDLLSIGPPFLLIIVIALLA
ncbi:MAG TPA: glycine/betaine ABC transporter, partial [Bacillales bacterium]|nr:glycine/betaine ABC transporter [Bacillales bacterium]